MESNWFHFAASNRIAFFSIAENFLHTWSFSIPLMTDAVAECKFWLLWTVLWWHGFTVPRLLRIHPAVDCGVYTFVNGIKNNTLAGLQLEPVENKKTNSANKKQNARVILLTARRNGSWSINDPMVPSWNIPGYLPWQTKRSVTYGTCRNFSNCSIFWVETESKDITNSTVKQALELWQREKYPSTHREWTE